MSNKFRLLCLLILSISVSQTALGQSCTAYVNASDGDDSNSGSIFSPLRSFEYAFNTLPSGTVLCVAAGEYFSGPDSDGILLSAPGKSMEFVLNSFAGENGIRFSEESFTIDITVGTVVFRAGTTDRLIFGRGITNSDDPQRSDLLNFLHTLRFTSGNIQFTGIQPVLESSVGVPDYANPENNSKVAPSSARIEFGTQTISGLFDYEPAERTFLFSGSVSDTINTLLPDSLLNCQFVFDSTEELTIPFALGLGNGSMRFIGPGVVRLDDDVSLDVAQGIIEIGGNAGPIEYNGQLQFYGSAGSREIIQHIGQHDLSISMLSAVSTSSSGNIDTSIRLSSLGSLTLRNASSILSEDGFQLFINIFNDTGSLLIGDQGNTTQLPGSLDNDGVLDLEGSIILGRNTSGVALENGGTIQLNGHDLSTGSPSVMINDGIISGSNGNVLLTDDTSVAGTGSWPATSVSGSVTFQGSSIHSETLTLETDAEMVVSEEASVTINSDLLSAGRSGVDISSSSFLSISGSTFLPDSDIVLRDGSEMRFTGDVDFGTSRFTNKTGAIVFSGASAKQLTISPESTLPSLRILGGTVLLPPVAAIGRIYIEQGLLSQTGTSGPLFVGGITATGGMISLNTPSITFTDDIELLGGTIDLSSASSVFFNHNLYWEDGELILPESGAVFSAEMAQTLQTTSSRSLPGLTVLGETTRLIITGAVHVASDLHLDEGRIALDSGSILTVVGSVLRTNGLLDGPDDSSLQITGSGTYIIAGFADVVLPSIVFDAASVLVPDNLSISGDINIASGEVNIQAGRIISTERSLNVTGGSVTVSAGGIIRVTEHILLVSGSLLSEPGASLFVGGNLDQTGAALSLEGSTLAFNGKTEQAVMLSSPLIVEDLSVLSSGTHVSINGAQDVVVRRQLSLAAGTMLSMNSSIVSMTGEVPGAGVANEGIISGSTGGLVFSGPALNGNQYSLSGSGVFGNTTIDLAEENAVIVGSGSGSDFTFSGLIRFSGGSIDVRGRPVYLSSTVRFPSLERNLASNQGDPNQIDAGWFSDSAGDLVFNPSAQPFDLTYTGDLSVVYHPGIELPSIGVRNLNVLARDVINTPPVFGVSLLHVVTVTGSVVVGEASVLRLSGFDLRSLSPQINHQISGIISGSGSLVIEGNDAAVISPNGSGEIERLVVSNPDPALPVRIEGFAELNRIDVDGGAVSFSAFSPGSSDPIRIVGGLYVVGAAVSIARDVEIISGSTNAQLSLDNAILNLFDSADLIMGPGTQFSANEGSSVFLLPDLAAASKNDPVHGFISFKGGTLVEAATSIPRLRLGSTALTGQSDDLTFTGDVYVSDVFELAAGDVILGSHDLFFSGQVFRKLNNDAPVDGSSDAIYGDVASNAGRLVLLSSAILDLRSDLSFFSSGLLIAGSSSDMVTVLSPDESAHRLILADRPFVMESGVLDLGLNDLVLRGSTGNAFIGLGGSIRATADPKLPQRRSIAHADPALFPYQDERYGEIIVGGIGTASMFFSTDFTIPNLTLQGTVELAVPSLNLTVSQRLSFGKDGSAFLTGTADRLHIGDGAVILRRGSGAISHPVAYDGDVDLFYALDDGSISGADSGFGPGTLPTAAEMPSAVRNLGVMAGQRSGISNTLSLTSPISISGTLSLFSGSLEVEDDEVRLLDGARLILDEVDPFAPVSFGPGRLATSTPVDVTFTIRFADLTTSATLIPNNPPGIRSFVVELGEPGLFEPVDLVLDRDIFAESARLYSFIPGSTINLAGSTISLTGSMNLDGGIIRSGALGHVVIGGEFVQKPGAEVQDAVSAEVSGSASLAGLFNGIELKVAGDLNVSGPLGSAVNLVFTGTNQRLFTETNLVVNSLELRQVKVGDSSPSVSIESNAASVEVSVLNELRLNSGILTTGDHTLRLPGSNGGFVRTVNLGVKSHVFGRIARNALTNSTSTFQYPVGDFERYRPISISFSDPLLTMTQLTVAISGETPVGTEGLPLSFADGTVVRGLTGYSWTLFSSVNFAQSQAIDIHATVEQTGQALAAHRLIARKSGSVVEKWRPASSANAVRIEPGLLLLDAVAARGALTPSGTQFSVGTPQASPYSGHFQFVHGNTVGSDRAVSVQINGQPAFPSVLFNQATASISLALDSASDSKRITVLDAVSGVILAESVTQIDSGENLFSALLSNHLAEPVVSNRSYVSTDPAPGSVFVSAVNGGPAFSHAILFSESSGATLGPVEPGEIGSESSVDAARQVFDLTTGQNAILVDQYEFDFSAVEGQMVHLLLTGSPPDSPPGALIVLTDGSVFPMRVVTGVEDVGAETELPLDLVLHPNYPNPFNPSTVISFDLPEAADVRMVVVDILGRQVAVLEAGAVAAGTGHSISFNGGELASGMYFYRIEATSGATRRFDTGKMILLK